MTRITPVLLSGGSGTRLWPLSRDKHPKQLLPLLGPESMLQMTARRVADGELFDPLIVIAKEAHGDLIEAQLAAVGVTLGGLILEPCPRNTAAAVALAALAAHDESLLLVLPSDHMIADQACFRGAIERAVPLAEQGWIITFGIRPDRAETGYGYIRQGIAIAEGVYRAERFVEKPDAATARTYVDEGLYHWNGGIFLFSARTMVEALARYAPDILEGVRVGLETGQRTGLRILPNERRFAGLRSQSIDHAVMEHAGQVGIVPVDMGWSDIGSWDALGDILEADAAGNVTVGDVTLLDTTNCLVRSEGRPVVAVGVRDLIVVETGDAILILPRGQAQRAKDAVEGLRGSHDDLL